MAEAERQPLISGDNSGSNEGKSSFEVRYEEARRQTRRFLGSKNGHYAVILMVAADVGGIFASFVLEHYLCTHECCQAKTQYRAWHEAEEALGIVSLVFSCLFMAELTASVWAFGLPYFNDWFHWLDAIVIIAGFVIDVVLRGVIEEVGSAIVVLRLWRVFKIVEEFSAGAEEQMDTLTERIEYLESENNELRKRLGYDGTES